MSQLSIKPANESDLAAIVELADRSGLAFWSRGDYAKAAASDDHLLLATKDKTGETTGFILVRLLARLDKTNDVEILNIAVEPKHRRSGVGAALIEAAVRDSHTGPESNVLLEVRESNASAIEFYRRLGFELQSIRRSYYRDPVEDALLFAATVSKLFPDTAKDR